MQYGNLLAIPYRVVIALCDLGFLFRGEVIWEKAKPLPEGNCRRPHRKHEGIYIFSKFERHSFQVKPPVGSILKLTTDAEQTAAAHVGQVVADLTPRSARRNSGVTRLML